MLYFDHNATAPLHPAAKAAWMEAQDRFPANPSSLHRMGKRAEAALDAARDFLAARLGCLSPSLVWTSGATESANAVFAHLSSTSEPTARVWISSVEHPCVADAAGRFFPGRVWEVPVNRSGALEIVDLEDALRREKPVALVLMAANNETGVLQPWREALELCRAVGVPFVCDATQWLGRLPVLGLGEADYVFGSGHKCGAPVGVGFMKVPPGFRGFLAGGPQEEGRRAGTQNVAGVVALEAALRACESRFAEVPSRVHVRGEVEHRLEEALPGLTVVGKEAERLWNTVSVVAPALGDCRQRWVVRLDAAGVAASSGSACASGREKPSRVLEAMGMPAGVSDRVLRLSCGWECPREDWDEVVVRMVSVWERWRGEQG
jgi:cysteine desulfurase